MRNIPYVKQYDSMGICINPIERGYPSNMFSNRRQRRYVIYKDSSFPKNNKKGIRLIVTNIGKGVFVKYTLVSQYIGFGKEKRCILHSVYQD